MTKAFKDWDPNIAGVEAVIKSPVTTSKKVTNIPLRILPAVVRELLHQEYRRLYIVISLDKEKAKVEAWKR
jgi:hypothetical protein